MDHLISKRKRFIGNPLACIIFMLLALGWTLAAFAATNEAVDPGGGGVSLLRSGAVTVNSVASGNAATSAVSEIAPNTVFANSTGNNFTYDVLLTMNAGDTGVNKIEITAPSGYSNLSVVSLSLGGAVQVQNCPIPGANQYCSSIAAQTMTIMLGSKVLVSGSDIRVSFTANAPGAIGSADFTATVDDTATAAVLPQATTAGNADGDPADANIVTVNVTFGPDAIKSTVTTNPQIVLADGAAFSTITTSLRNTANQPVSGRNITLSSDRGVADIFVQPVAPSDMNGIATGTVRSSTVGMATITSTDTTDTLVLNMKPQIYFTQGMVLELIKKANKQEAVIGDVITYLIEIRNKTAKDVVQVHIQDQIPPNFKYLKKTARLNGASIPDPSGNRTLTFDIGTVRALVDGNGNGKADPGEQGYATLSYQLVIGSGATPREYVNTVVANDVCDACVISNSDQAEVSVTLDPIFDLGTIIGKVFEDKNEDGRQDRDEQGIAGAMVVLDDGTYAITDEYGRYHFPGVKPGHRLVKINLQNLPAGAITTTDEAHVVSVTPGLLAKVNFGVIYRYDTEKIGRAKEYGLLMMSEGNEEPVQVVGSTETLTVLINGQMAHLPTNDVRLEVAALDDIIEIKGSKLDNPIEFTVSDDQSESVVAWKLVIVNARGEAIRTIEGSGAPSESIRWDGLTEEKALVKGGEIYHYQMEIQYADGSISSSACRTFGVNRTSAISLNLSGGAFETGSTRLSQKARTIMKEVADVLRKYPEEKIIVEGHTDSTGTKEINDVLSRDRAEAAVAYLVNDEQIPSDRFAVKWYGETRPIASNDSEEGRELNRRVEVKGEVQVVRKTKLNDQFRTIPTVQINGTSLKIGPKGRFSAKVDGKETDHLDVEVVNAQGRSLRTAVPLPELEIVDPTGELRLPYRGKGEHFSVESPSEREGWNPDRIALTYQLVGKTEPGNEIEFDGKPLTPDPDGRFTAPLELKLGNNAYGIMVRNPSGYTRIVNLMIAVANKDDKGRLIIALEPVPNLAVKLPPRGTVLKDPLLPVSGLTDPGNQVLVNGNAITVQPDGSFSTNMALPEGKSRIVVKASDPEGYTGTIEREVEVSNTHLFLLGFADGKIGQLQGKGYLQGAGMDKAKEFYTEGRLAFYLKGVILGKYLITSAFDTGTQSFDKMFKNLDTTDNDILFTNLDPDKYYPVYGDSSTVVYDAQSQGKFYLALESDEFNLLVGNYPIQLTGTELAAYQRTLYGGRLAYTSVSHTRYGNPDTEVTVFGADVRQIHATDELSATGGSLYYLSHRNIIEGSEQVNLVVRDKNTGLVLARVPQVQNADYTINYDEGRILFNRPISSVVEDESLINHALLAGNPVSIQVDYETKVDSFEKTADGGRVRKQIGDHLSVGGTYVQDKLTPEQYELKGVDTEIRLGKNTRILGEFAESTGKDSLVATSNDGGLTFTEGTQGGPQEGSAWKAAAELDLGEWFGMPDRFQVGGYIRRLDPGFVSNGNFLESGTQKAGINTKLQLTKRDTLHARYDWDENLSSAPSMGGDTDIGAVQWVHDHGWWLLTSEYQTSNAMNDAGNATARQDLGAVKLRLNLTDTFSMSVERQQTISGARNDQTSLGLKYEVLPSLALTALGTKGTLGQSAQGGAVLTLGDKRLYLTERVAEDQADSTTSTIIGTEASLDASSKIYSEYQWEHSGNGGRNISLTGAQKQWDIGGGLKLLILGEHSKIDSSSNGGSRDAIAAGLLYENPAGIKASTRDEIRREKMDQDTVQFLTTNYLELKLNPDFTLLGKYRYSQTRDPDSDETEAEFEEISIGLAYRPVKWDRLNALSRYTRLMNEGPLVPGQGEFGESLVTKKDVASLEWSLDLNRYIEWVEKGALKIQTEEDGDRPAVTTHTYLSINRLNFAVWRKLDLGLEYRILVQDEADDMREGWLIELMWELVKHIRIGGGYNFTEFSDNEFSDNNYSVQGWFVRLQGKY